jgi:hypothetical protein
MMKNSFLLLMIFVYVTGCHKKFDTPPYQPVSEGASLTISKLKARCALANSFYHFSSNGDTNLYCTVTMDETSGNLYKQVYVKDDGGSALLLKLVNSGGLFTGDKVRINLNNCWIVSAASNIYIDSLDIEKSLVKISSGNKVTPLVTTISKILSNTNPQGEDNFQSQLVEINNVEFVFNARGKTFANAVGKTAAEYDLTDCNGVTLPVRTSGLCNFAGKVIPSANGKIIGVVQQYNNGMSLVIRNYNELQMNSSVCTFEPADTSGTKFLYKDFNDNVLLSGGWLQANVTGTTSWVSSNIGQSSYYARIYNKNGSTYEACEAWLISPEINLTGASDPIINFVAANSSTASPLSLMVSENFSGGMPSSAVWTALTFAFQKNSFTYFPSGDISLSAYKGKKIRVAYKYTGTATSGSIWDVDNVLIKEK